MLIFARCIYKGSTHNKLPLDVSYTDSVSVIRDLLKTKVPNVNFTRILFAGKILDDDSLSLKDYDLNKECIIQAMGTRIGGVDEEIKKDVVPPPKLDLSRQYTDQAVQFGDILIVKLVGARSLVGKNYFNGKSDPYAIIAVGKQSFRSRMITKTVNPVWKETYGWLIDSPNTTEETLSCMIWDHDYLSADELLGHVDIPLNNIERGKSEGTWYTLEGVPHGEVQLIIRRSPISSPELKHIVLSLVQKDRAWTASRLAKYGVTIKHFLGETPFTVNYRLTNSQSFDGSLIDRSHYEGELLQLSGGANRNPALVRLRDLCKEKTIKLQNRRTVEKVQNILWTQQATFTHDLPTCHIWLCNVTVKQERLWTVMQNIAGGSLKSLCVFPAICCVPDGKKAKKSLPGCAVAVFKQSEDAVLTLLCLQNRKMGAKTLQVGFDDPWCAEVIESNTIPIRMEVKDENDQKNDTTIHPFADSIRTGILSVLGPHKTVDQNEQLDEQDKDWILVDKQHKHIDYAEDRHALAEWCSMICVLSRSNVGHLELYSRLQSSEPEFLLDLKSCLILTCGPWSIELVDMKNKVTFYFRSLSSEVLTEWKDLFKGIKRGKWDHLSNAEEKDDGIQIGAEILSLESYFKCVQCNNARPMNDAYILDAEDGRGDSVWSCRECLQREVVSQLESKNSEEVLKQFSFQDLKDLSVADRFENFLDQTCTDLIESLPNRFLKCPSCDIAVEISFHDWSSKQSAISEKLGLDNRPLTKAAMKHYLGNRFFCRNCSKNFCRICRNINYHTGFTCEEYKDYLVSPKCRFCGVTVMDRNRMKNPESEALHSVCDTDECVDKAKRSCTRILPCDHPCGGCRGELDCLPCLRSQEHDENSYDEKTEDEKKSIDVIRLTDGADDLCSICYTEELGLAPSIQLGCGHVFHYHCVLTRIDSKWHGARVSFRFCYCPLCNQWMTNPHIDLKLEEYDLLHEKIMDLVRERALIEDLQKDERVSEPASEFYNDSLRYGMKIYAYYICKECNDPYFGGRRACEANMDEEVNPDELVCLNCAEILATTDCGKPEHKEYLSWKCRYCCSESVWFCFGTTHFCDFCHSHSGPNRDKRAQCPPIGQTTCPLGLKPGNHKNGPNNDCELALGCGICIDNIRRPKIEEQKELEQTKEKLLKEKTTKYLATVLPADLENRVFEYKSDFDENGLFYFLGSVGKTQEWTNPADHDAKLVKVSSSSISKVCRGVNIITGRKSVICQTLQDHIITPWFQVDLLKDLAISVSTFTLRHHPSLQTPPLSNFRLEGSNAGDLWDCIHECVQDQLLTTNKTHTASWKIPKQDANKSYKKLRIRRINPPVESLTSLPMALSGLEVYGTLVHSLPLDDLKAQEKLDEIQRIEHWKSISSFRWHHEDLPKNLAVPFDEDCLIVRNTGSNNQWRMVRALNSVKEGAQFFSMKIDTDPHAGTNSWGMCFGAVSPEVNLHSEAFGWVGAQAGSWGYNGGSGDKMTTPGDNSPYGRRYGDGDIIGMLLDFENHMIDFFVNGVNQGTAFTNLEGDVYPAVSLTATNSQIRILSEESKYDPYPVDWEKLIEIRRIQKEVRNKRWIELTSAEFGDAQKLDVEAGKETWDPCWSSCFAKMPGRELFYPQDGTILTRVVNIGSGEYWRVCRSVGSYSSGVHFFEFRLLNDPESSNMWRTCVGVVQTGFFGDYVGSKDSWGYVAATGVKVCQDGGGSDYGQSFTEKDVIGMKVDLDKGTLEFFKNYISQGAAYDNIYGPVHAAASLTGTGAEIELVKGDAKMLEMYEEKSSGFQKQLLNPDNLVCSWAPVTGDLQCMEEGSVLVNKCETSQWRTCFVGGAISGPGVYYFSVRMEYTPETPNNWKFLVGVAHVSFEIRHGQGGRAPMSPYIGGQERSWAYILGTGEKLSSAGRYQYGEECGINDVVGVCIDFYSNTVEFFKNEISQGVAHYDLCGPVLPGISCIANGVKVRLIKLEKVQ